MRQSEIDAYLLRRLVYWRDAMLGFEDGVASQILAVLREVKAELEKGLSEAFEISEWTEKRMEAIREFCEEVLAGAEMTVTGQIDEAFVAAAEASLQNYNTMLGFNGELVNFSPASMTAEQVKSWFGDTPLGGQLLGGWVDKAFGEGVRKSVLAAVQKCGVMGLGYPGVTKKILQTALDEGMALTRREAITIGRTFVQTANVQAQMAVYRAHEDLLSGYRWCSILDTGVCARCGALDGAFYKKDEQRPLMPLHPRCRCLWLPVVKGDELKGDLEKAARPWLRRELKNIDDGGTRKILNAGTTKEDFSGWWETLPEKEQKFSVGPVRAKLLREGKIKFSDLVDKSTGRLKTLEELGFSESGKLLASSFVKAETGKWLKDVVGNIQKGVFKPKNERHVVGTIEEAVGKTLEAMGITLASNELTISDGDICHALRSNKVDPLPYALWERLPDVLQKAKSVYWDNIKPGIIFVIEENGTLGKLVAQPNHKIGRGSKAQIVNNLRTGRKINNLNEFLDYVHYSKLK